MKEQIQEILDNAKIVSIVPSGRSGSYFVQSLLDSHENVLNIPFYIDIRTIYKNTSQFMNRKLNLDAILDYICNKSQMRNLIDKNYNDMLWEHLKVIINGKMDNIKIDAKKFRENLKEALTIVHEFGRLDEWGFRVALNVAFAKTIGKNIKEIQYIVDPTHCYRPMKSLYAINKNTKFINTVRDPRASYYSYYEMNKAYSSGKERFHPVLVNCAFNYTFFSFEKIKEYRKSWLRKENYLMVRLEDMHNSFERVVEEIARFLNIPLKKTLYKSTMAGYIWPSESFTHKRSITGKDPASTAPKWKEKLSRKQIRNAEFLSSVSMDEQNYKKIYWKTAGFSPAPLLSFMLEQIRQTDFFGINPLKKRNFARALITFISGRVKLIYYVLFFKPYKTKK